MHRTALVDSELVELRYAPGKCRVLRKADLSQHGFRPVEVGGDMLGVVGIGCDGDQPAAQLVIACCDRGGGIVSG